MVVESADYITYPRRWYILAIYSLNASLQACIFNTWGPIAQSAKLAFCWSDAVVAWMGNMMLLVGIVAVPLSYSIINSFGLRTTVVWSGSGVLAVGALVRCISMDGSIQQWTSLLCGAMNGWASIMIECTLTVLSVKWFPAGERTTATGIVIATQMAGLIPPSLLFPKVVQEPGFNQTNCTENIQLAETIRMEVSYILYAEAALACAIFGAMILYFPDAPPSPPSASATAQRLNIKEGLSNIFTSPKNICIGFAFSCITVPMMWITVANQNLHPLGLTQQDTGYIGTIIIVTAVIMNIFNSRLSDKFSGHLKTTICCFLAVSLAAALWLALLCFEIAPFSKLSVYISSITCMVSLRCIIALFYELLMEVHYPTPESLASLTWGQLGRIFSAIFLGMFSLESAGILQGFTWMNYCLVIFIALPLISLLLVRVEYKRSDHDRTEALVHCP